MNNQAYLILENGRVFTAKRFGKNLDTCGELVFNTSMTAYNEILTDPRYSNQIVIQTFPLIGNYGVISEDFESSKIHMKGYIAREFCEFSSNFRNEDNIDNLLKRHNIARLFDIDTRALTKIICEYGVMNAKITSDVSNLDEQLKEIKSYKNLNAVSNVSSREEKYINNNGDFKVALFDFGVRNSTIRELEKRNCDIVILPFNTNYQRIKELSVDGIVLSNGPGNPTDNKDVIEEIKKIYSLNIPMFGIGLGHQLMALASGAKIFKLKYGHRGANHPVMDINTRSIYITNQNHGYAVSTESLPYNIKTIFKNLNDSTCEGLEYLNHPSFSVQFDPESCSGNKKSNFLFDRFIDLMKENKLNAVK